MCVRSKVITSEMPKQIEPLKTLGELSDEILITCHPMAVRTTEERLITVELTWYTVSERLNIVLKSYKVLHGQ
jgi:hypothetical protein